MRGTRSKCSFVPRGRCFARTGSRVRGDSFIYYAESWRRVSVPFTEELIARTR